MAKYSINQKLEVLDELIAEFRENASLWSVKKQALEILNDMQNKQNHQSSNGSKKEIVNVGGFSWFALSKPEYNKHCVVLTAKDKFKAYFSLAYDGGEWLRLSDDKPITEPVLKWAYILDVDNGSSPLAYKPLSKGQPPIGSACSIKTSGGIYEAEYHPADGEGAEWVKRSDRTKVTDEVYEWAELDPRRTFVRH